MSVDFPHVPAGAGNFSAVDGASKIVRLDGWELSWSRHFIAGPYLVPDGACLGRKKWEETRQK